MTTASFDVDSWYKNTNVTLSNSNLTATVTSGTGSVRCHIRNGTFCYWEMVIGATMSGACSVGVVALVFSLGGQLGGNVQSIGYQSGGTVLFNGSTVATLTSFTANDNIGVAVDMLNSKIWFRKNGGNWNNDVIGNQNPVGAVGGISIASMTPGPRSSAWAGAGTSSATGQWSSASWTYTAPSGFISVEAVAAAGVATRTGNSYRYQLCSPGFAASPDTPGKTISGTVKEGVTNVAKKVFLYDAATGRLLDSTVSDASTGAYSLQALARTGVFAVALDPTYQALVYDQITPQ